MAKDKFNTADEEENQKSQKGNAIGGILAMLPSIAGAIPGLMKSKQTGALRDMQQGRGAGAMAARQAGSEAGRRTAGNVGGRGSSGQVRAGLRSAEEMTSRGAQAAGLIGAREGMFATQALMGDEERRRNLGLQLGAGVGGAAAAGLATGLAGADQGPAGAEVAGALTRDPMGLREATTGGEAGIGSVFGTPGRAFGESPSLIPGAPGTPEAFGSLVGPDVGLESVGDQPVSPDAAIPTAPDVELAQPDEAFDAARDEGFALQAMMSPADKFDMAQLQYTELVTRPSERPLKSKGGSDDVAYKSVYEQRLLKAVEQGILDEKTAADAARYYNVTGREYGLAPEGELPTVSTGIGAGSR